MTATLMAPAPPDGHAPDAPRRLRTAYGIDSMAGSGGTELHAVRLAETVRAFGVDPIVVTLNAAGPMGARYAAAGIPVHGFPVDSLVGRAAFRQVRALAALFRRERIDVVHAHDCYTNFLVVLAGRLAGVPLVIASKRWTQHLYPQHAWTNRLAFRAAHRVIANSSAVAASVVADEWIAPGKIVVQNNFLDDAAGRPLRPDERVAARARLGLSATDLTFVIVAQLRIEKDHEFLFAAFERLVRRYPTARLLVAGDGPERARLEALIGTSALDDHVRLLGHVPVPRAVLAAADVAVLSSRHEGSPNALIEAMAAGLPVVSTRAGGVVDAVVHEETGLLADVGDLEAFVVALERVAASEELRHRLGEAGHRDVVARYHVAASVGRLAELYRRLVSRVS